MKKVLLFGWLMSLSVFAEDTSFKIKQFNMVGDQGSLISNEFTIKSTSGEVGFKSIEDDFVGEVILRDKVMLIQGTNGMFIKASAPVDIKSIPETSITNAILINKESLLSLQAEAVTTSISNFHLDVSNLLFRCEQGICQASASRLVIDNNLKIQSPTFFCPQEKCIEHFKLTINQLDNNLLFRVRSVQARGLIDLNDISGIELKREASELHFNGKVKIPLFGKVDFILRASIITQTKEKLELQIRKVVVGKLLSVTDLTMFLAKKLLGSKSFIINDDIISINLKE